MNELNNLIEELHSNEGICAIFDRELKYVYLNEAGCNYLRINLNDIKGKAITEMYPGVASSKNHVNLIKAKHGTCVYADIQGANGEYFRTLYEPKKVNGLVELIVVKSMHI